MTRKCALVSCSIAFTARPRQLYCTPEHSMAARDARRPFSKCAHCAKPLPKGELRRFCGLDCRTAYAAERRGKRGKYVRETVVVLLPLGCKPSPVTTAELQGGYGEIARKIYCARMERCLSYAVAKNWGGMSCAGCDVEEPVTVPLRPKGSNWSW